MNTTSIPSRKFCFISNSNQSYLGEYIDFTRNDSNIDFSFENIDLEELKTYNPSIIIIDQYFCEQDYSFIINSLKDNFKNANIYFLSPEYSDHDGIVQSDPSKNHYYSNFCVDILNHINADSGNTILEAS